MEAPGIVFPDADKSQLAMAESPASDRIAFALCPPRNRTAHVPSREKLGIYRSYFRAVRSLQSGLSTNNREILAYSRISAQSERNFSAVKTAWRRGKDSNPQYGFAALSLDVSAKLQIAKPYQRISQENPTSELCHQSGFDSPSIRT
jgi:hypothetical protein